MIVHFCQIHYHLGRMLYRIHFSETNNKLKIWNKKKKRKISDKNDEKLVVIIEWIETTVNCETLIILSRKKKKNESTREGKKINKVRERERVCRGTRTE